MGYTLNVAKGGYKDNISRMPISWSIYTKMQDDNWKKIDERFKSDWKHGDQIYFPISANNVQEIRIKFKKVKNLSNLIRFDSIKYYSKKNKTEKNKCDI